MIGSEQFKNCSRIIRSSIRSSSIFQQIVYSGILLVHHYRTMNKSFCRRQTSFLKILAPPVPICSFGLWTKSGMTWCLTRKCLNNSTVILLLVPRLISVGRGIFFTLFFTGIVFILSIYWKLLVMEQEAANKPGPTDRDHVIVGELLTEAWGW